MHAHQDPRSLLTCGFDGWPEKGRGTAPRPILGNDMGQLGLAGRRKPQRSDLLYEQGRA